MAKKKPKPKRPPRPPVRPEGRPSGASPRGGANPARRERKQEAREAREQARKRATRRNAARRAVGFSVAGAVAIAAIFLLNRGVSPGSLSEEALAAATAAGCSELRTPAASAPGNLHLEPGQDPGYTEKPATSGAHAQSPLDPTTRIYEVPVAETNAVHTLEHGSVIAYYRLPAEGGVSQEVVDALAAFVPQQDATYLMPYPDLPPETSLAVTAWNKIVTCPQGITPDQATAVVQGFVEAFACSTNAPEGPNGDGC